MLPGAVAGGTGEPGGGAGTMVFDPVLCGCPIPMLSGSLVPARSRVTAKATVSAVPACGGRGWPSGMTASSAVTIAAVIGWEESATMTSSMASAAASAPPTTGRSPRPGIAPTVSPKKYSVVPPTGTAAKVAAPWTELAEMTNAPRVMS